VVIGIFESRQEQWGKNRGGVAAVQESQGVHRKKAAEDHVRSSWGE